MTLDHEVFLRLAEITKICSLSPAQIYRMEKRGDFPKRIRIGVRRVAWSAGEIAQWQSEKLEHRATAANNECGR